MGKNRKSKRKKKNSSAGSLLQTVLDVFNHNPFKAFTFSQVVKTLGINDKASKQLVKEMLARLLANNQLISIKRGRYQLNPGHGSPRINQTVITGLVDMKRTGKAYIISDEVGEDIFVAANNTGKALDGDTVRVQLLPKRPNRKTEGQIIEIVKRGKSQFVGVVETGRSFAFLIPDDPSIPVDIFIPLEKLKGAKDGQKAIARITDWPDHSKNPFGELIDILGYPGNNEVEMKSILANYDFPLEFPISVEKEAEKITGQISRKEIRKRRDFRDVLTFTIDPEDAKDFDDALSIKKAENGLWEVGVHIADVSHYVSPGSIIDDEAYTRATSIYLVDRVIPMLPEKLSNGVCSLRPNEEKLCFSAVFHLDENAKVHDEWFGKTVIKSDRRYNYEEVQEILEGKDGDYSAELRLLNKMAAILRKVRFSKGSIAFRSQDVRFKLDEEGKPLKVFIKEQKNSNKLIEDFMLLANRKVAEKIGRRRGKSTPKTFVYRVHDQPNPDKLAVFSEFVGKLGYDLKLTSPKSISKSLNTLFAEVAGKAEENMIETIAVRTMAKAEYSTQNIGHYGLAFSYYTHFTSPIRRYPDLMVHRLLEHYLSGGESVKKADYEDKCVHSSEMERKAVEAERDSIKLKQAEYMLDKIGQEFDGVISGVSKYGIYVELRDTMSEGMVPLRDMLDDFYYLDEENFRVVGQRYGYEYKIGDEVRIKVKMIDLSKKQMNFELVD